MTDSKTTYFQGIDALRFFAAFAIIIYHCTRGYQYGMDNSLKIGLHNLVVGVDLFFIISGFLITYLLMKEKENFKTISLGNFYIRRTLRIFPLYYLIVIFSYLAFSSQNPDTDFISHFAFLGNFSLISHGKWTITALSPLWSICIEEHFYLFIPILILIIPNQKLKHLYILIIVSSILFRLYITYNVKYNWMTIYVHTLSRCDVIAAGGLIAILYTKKGEIFKFSSKILLISILLFIIVMGTFDYGDYTTLINASLKKYLFVLPLFFIFLCIVFPKKENGIIRFMRKNKQINYFGKISYGIYMYHSIVILYMCKISFINKSYSLKIIFGTLLTILISALSYELIEKKILSLKSKFEVIKSVRKDEIKPLPKPLSQ